MASIDNKLLTAAFKDGAIAPGQPHRDWVKPTINHCNHLLDEIKAAGTGGLDLQQCSDRTNLSYGSCKVLCQWLAGAGAIEVTNDGVKKIYYL